MNFINSERVRDQFSEKSFIHEDSEKSSSFTKNSNSFLTKSCDLKTALSISRKDLINSCKMKKRYCSFITSELLNNKKKQQPILPLSRSASWSEVDMLGDNEEFIEIYDVEKTKLTNNDNKPVKEMQGYVRLVKSH